MKKVILYLCIVFYGLSGLCQDTLSVYFESGSSKINNNYTKTFEELEFVYAGIVIDSITLTGFADSIGSLSSNRKLSLKRAERTMNTLTQFSPIATGVITKVYAKGEHVQRDYEQSRRVDVIFYFETPKTSSVEENQEKKIGDDQCYYIDEKLLAYCKIDSFKRGSRDYVSILAPDFLKRELYKLYYVVLQKDKRYDIFKVRWKEVRGANYYKTEILKSSYDTYRLFIIKQGPCEDCSIKTFEIRPAPVLETEELLFYDGVIMSNYEVRKKFLDENSIKIRVPKQYVDTSKLYFTSYSYKPKLLNESDRIKWYRHSRSYYYAYIPVEGRSIAPIYVKKTINACNNKDERLVFNYRESRFPCFYTGGCIINVPPISRFYLESGAFYQGLDQPSYIGYIAAGYEIERYIIYRFAPRINFKGGINTKIGFHGSVSLDNSLIYFGLDKRKRRKIKERRWQYPTTYCYTNEKYFTCYYGTELKTSLDKLTPLFLEQNLHVGVAYIHKQNRGKFYIRKVYVNFGKAYDYLKNIENNFYTTGSMGLQVSFK